MRDIFKFRFAGTFMMLVMIAVFGAVVMLLWNALLPDLFALPALNYWQAAGILLLVRILAGGLGHNFGYFDRNRRGTHFHGGQNRLREKWMNMSEEERKEFVEKEKDYMGFHAAFHGRFPHLDHPFTNEDKQEKETKNE